MLSVCHRIPHRDRGSAAVDMHWHSQACSWPVREFGITGLLLFRCLSKPSLHADESNGLRQPEYGAMIPDDAAFQTASESSIRNVRNIRYIVRAPLRLVCQAYHKAELCFSGATM